MAAPVIVDSYGLCYFGSKNKVCSRIPILLRSRAVDLFGGGGAISHYLAVHGAPSVLYNEKNPQVAAAFAAALRGEFPEENLIGLSQPERRRLADSDPVLAFLLAYSPGHSDRSTYAKEVEFGRRLNRFRVVRNASISSRVTVICGDYTGFEFIRPDPDVSWYIDPPYAGQQGYTGASGWSWSWCDQITGPIVGFDSFVPDGFRELWRSSGQTNRAAPHYWTICFYRPGIRPTDRDAIEVSEQLGLGLDYASSV